MLTIKNNAYVNIVSSFDTLQNKENGIHFGQNEMSIFEAHTIPCIRNNIERTKNGKQRVQLRVIYYIFFNQNIKLTMFKFCRHRTYREESISLLPLVHNVFHSQ